MHVIRIEYKLSGTTWTLYPDPEKMNKHFFPLHQPLGTFAEEKV